MHMLQAMERRLKSESSDYVENNESKKYNKKPVAKVVSLTSGESSIEAPNDLTRSSCISCLNIVEMESDTRGTEGQSQKPLLCECENDDANGELFDKRKSRIADIEGVNGSQTELHKIADLVDVNTESETAKRGRYTSKVMDKIKTSLEHLPKITVRSPNPIISGSRQQIAQDTKTSELLGVQNGSRTAKSAPCSPRNHRSSEATTLLNLIASSPDLTSEQGSRFISRNEDQGSSGKPPKEVVSPTSRVGPTNSRLGRLEPTMITSSGTMRKTRLPLTAEVRGIPVNHARTKTSRLEGYRSSRAGPPQTICGKKLPRLTHLTLLLILCSATIAPVFAVLELTMVIRNDVDYHPYFLMLQPFNIALICVISAFLVARIGRTKNSRLLMFQAFYGFILASHLILFLGNVGIGSTETNTWPAMVYLIIQMTLASAMIYLLQKVKGHDFHEEADDGQKYL